jgi:hypothetical protein
MASRKAGKNGRRGARAKKAGRPPDDPSGAGVDVSLWLPKPLARKLTLAAKRLGVSRSQFAKQILQGEIDRYA